MKPVEKGVVRVPYQCKCGVRMFENEGPLWCARNDCPKTDQRGPTEWQRRCYKLDEPWDPFGGSRRSN